MPEHWIFAYGSLMWDPQVPVAETVVARADGYARSFCMRSIQYRGSVEAPGLVLGLDPCDGGACSGVALRFDPGDWPEALAEIRKRELVTEAYREAELTLTLADGRRVAALAYVMRHDHWQYAGGLSGAEQARIIAAARGLRGPNADYLFNTVAHLDELGLPDPALTELAARVRGLIAPADGAPPARDP
ncbi:gamma-glutamylcyclotransferase [Paracoccus marinus]|uniref:gamma-glutamylcyclotransferase n=1 Tax=Paracoccus marinus TaxID=288426 RepID=UPI00103D93AC|nr:gamma-glutamylcyclotransferase [Paracoccus marinus]GLS79316.1 gamma-glutamylcyclotransferase [Paracoccus marinus]